MKQQTYRLHSKVALLVVGLLFSMIDLSLGADGKVEHEHKKKIAGPNGGRVITTVKPHLEFFLTKDRKVKITAVDDHNKPIAISGQSVKVSGGSRFLPTRLKFEKEKGALISTKSFPEGKRLPVVVQIKVAPDSKTVTTKFYLDMSTCPECKYVEYACTCDH